MRAPIPYLYRVQHQPKARRARWSLSVIPPYGEPTEITTYRTLRCAIGAARTLATGGGMVEVRS